MALKFVTRGERGGHDPQLTGKGARLGAEAAPKRVRSGAIGFLHDS